LRAIGGARHRTSTLGHKLVLSACYFQLALIPSGGGHGGDFLATITPGIKLKPLDNRPDLEVGAGLSLPITDDKEFHARHF
jgi:hypothetical protein